jgi:hypothetical protein
MEKGQAQRLLIRAEKGSQVPARVTPWGFDLDHVSAQVAQKTAHIGTEWCSNIQDA